MIEKYDRDFLPFLLSQLNIKKPVTLLVLESLWLCRRSFERRCWQDTLSVFELVFLEGKHKVRRLEHGCVNIEVQLLRTSCKRGYVKRYHFLACLLTLSKSLMRDIFSDHISPLLLHIHVQSFAGLLQAVFA